MRERLAMRFQSLFFWMLLSKAVHNAIGMANDMSFNPYFSGCFSLRLQIHRILLVTQLVSILLFLDASL